MGTRVSWKSRDEEGPHPSGVWPGLRIMGPRRGQERHIGDALTDPVTRKQQTGMPTSSGTSLGTEAMSTNGNRGVHSGRGALMCPS